MDTPAPDVTAGELDSHGRNHYDRVREYCRTQPVTEYDVSRHYDAPGDRLTPLFYLADRSMRESDFDPSGRFGPFSAGILDYNPVDLNGLIYRMEMDTASIHALLDQPREAALWAEPEGLYFDYDFERAGGLQTSGQLTGDQWDAPFGWAPMQILSVEGFRRYGFQAEAHRVSVEFLFRVLRDFEAHRSIKEKYDVVNARSDLGAGVRFGYASNEIGFGWTNAAFLTLYDALTSPAKAKFLERCRTRAEVLSSVAIVNPTMLLQ